MGEQWSLVGITEYIVVMCFFTYVISAIRRFVFMMWNGLTLDNSNTIICVAYGTGNDCFRKY